MPHPLLCYRPGPANGLLRTPALNPADFTLSAMRHPVCPVIHPTGVSLGAAFALLCQARMTGICAGGFDPAGPCLGLIGVLTRHVCALFNPLNPLFGSGCGGPGGRGGHQQTQCGPAHGLAYRHREFSGNRHLVWVNSRQA